MTRPLLIIELFLITTSLTLLSFSYTAFTSRQLPESISNASASAALGGGGDGESTEAALVEAEFSSNAMSALHFFQIIRFLYIDRHAQTWILLMKVVQKHRFELLSSVYIGVIILLFSSYFILLVEKPYSEQQNDNHFHSYADALYWSIITMATIGYGNKNKTSYYYPTTTTTKTNPKMAILVEGYFDIKIKIIYTLKMLS